MGLKHEKCQNIIYRLIQMNILITLKTKFAAELTIIHMRVNRELTYPLKNCKLELCIAKSNTLHSHSFNDQWHCATAIISIIIFRTMYSFCSAFDFIYFLYISLFTVPHFNSFHAVFIRLFLRLTG